MDIKMMSVADLVRYCKLFEGTGANAGKIGFPGGKLPKGVEVKDIAARKPEILDYFKAEAARKEEDKRKAMEITNKINAIAGLKEIRAARADVAAWNDEFRASFRDCGGLGVRSKPEYDFAAMYAQYPVAAAYLKAESYANKSNYEMAAIGRAAKTEIIENPENHVAIIAKMDEALSAHTKAHAWD